MNEIIVDAIGKIAKSVVILGAAGVAGIMANAQVTPMVKAAFN